MPELPEVETVKNGLAPFLKDREIATVDLYRADLRFPFPDGFAGRLTGRMITDLTRRAKYILIHLDDGMVWILHLGMSGSVAIAPAPGPEKRKHDHVVVTLKDGTVMRYNDPRRFGFMALCSGNALADHEFFAHLGPEPLGPDFTVSWLRDVLSKRKSAIKVALLDQKTVVGVGNIYACESLYRAGINPKKPAHTVSKAAIARLIPVIQQVLQDALDSGGSSLKDFVHADGEMGYFQHRFDVYDRENEPCRQCDNPIQRMVQQGRSTFWCPKCQK